jgi:hypothetical protein
MTVRETAVGIEIVGGLAVHVVTEIEMCTVPDEEADLTMTNPLVVVETTRLPHLEIQDTMETGAQAGATVHPMLAQLLP